MYNITLPEMFKMNPLVEGDCFGFKPGSDYCVVALTRAPTSKNGGFDTGIATTSTFLTLHTHLEEQQLTDDKAIAYKSWIEYMGHPSNGLTGAVVAVYKAGEALGALTQTVIGDKIGRIRFMQLMCIIVTIGTVV
ncbi:hypothetical protein IFR04_009015 [Cadophora malorum]|uniref:Major facilitator superfamily (MFS) profile domain-containing protein n=1 Tax=Cadophora malorum TaxID=108018 RepID=A0A8H7TFJ8_9HELO|nr:hypothetical protein IFR04_009015 [Cadophora malorum]